MEMGSWAAWRRGETWVHTVCDCWTSVGDGSLLDRMMTPGLASGSMGLERRGARFLCGAFGSRPATWPSRVTACAGAMLWWFQWWEAGVVCNAVILHIVHNIGNFGCLFDRAVRTKNSQPRLEGTLEVLLVSHVHCAKAVYIVQRLMTINSPLSARFFDFFSWGSHPYRVWSGDSVWLHVGRWPLPVEAGSHRPLNRRWRVFQPVEESFSPVHPNTARGRDCKISVRRVSGGKWRRDYSALKAVPKISKNFVVYLCGMAIVAHFWKEPADKSKSRVRIYVSVFVTRQENKIQKNYTFSHVQCCGHGWNRAFSLGHIYRTRHRDYRRDIDFANFAANQKFRNSQCVFCVVVLWQNHQQLKKCNKMSLRVINNSLYFHSKHFGLRDRTEIITQKSGRLTKE